MSTKVKWSEVNAEHPCPICEKPDYCRRSPDGNRIACRRESQGATKTRRYKDGSEYFVHVLRDDRPANRSGKRSKAKPADKPVECADLTTLDRVYRRLLDELALSPPHREALRTRGLTDSAIETGNYRTLPKNTGPTIKKLRAELGDDILLSVPGLLKTTIAAPPGLLIPVRNVEGQIVALKLRRDEAKDSGKYLYLSSTKQHGPGPGSPAHVPTGITGPCDLARITEGEFKADVATALSGIPTISFPGVTSWRTVLPVLKTLQVKTVRLAFDADAMENENVARCLLESFQALAGDGFAVELERWDAANGKGIDNLLAAGGKPEVLTGDNALQAAREIAKAAGVQDKQSVADEITALVNERLNDSPQALFADEKLLGRIAKLSVGDPDAYASVRQTLRDGRVRLRDFDHALKKRVIEAVKEQPPEFARGATGGFFEGNGSICRTKLTPHGLLTVPLANFVARIVDETVRDDGAESRVMLGISGKLANGRLLRRIEVAGEAFSRLDWVVPNWGSDAIVWPGEARSLPAAIQALSIEKERRTVFCHTGWRKMNGRWIYLHASGAIGLPRGDATVSVDLQPPLEKYVLPKPTNQIDAILACLRLLELAPDRLMFPVLAATFRAAGGGVDFALHLAGASGVFKSELAALAQQHFGPELDARNLPGNWSSTGNSLEYAAFLAKDAVFVVDDFAPTGSSGDVQRLHREADRLLRAQGNQSGRQRMTRDGQLRPAKPPRGLIVSTGEDVPRGQSLRARLFTLDVSAGDIDQLCLTKCQSDASGGLYAQGMAGFIDWLAPRYDAIVNQLPDELQKYRSKATNNGYHARTPGIVAQLAIGWRLFLRFATDAKAISESQLEMLFGRGWEAFIDAANSQADQQIANEPAAHFVRLLTAAIATGRAYVADIVGDKPDAAESWGWRSGQASGELVGWLDGDRLYLEPDASFAAVQRLAGLQNETIAVGQTTLRRRLRERGYLAETDTTRQTLTVRKTISGTRREILSLRANCIRMKPDQPDQTTTSADAASSCGGQVGCENPTTGNRDTIMTNAELVGLVGFSTGVETKTDKKQFWSGKREQFDL
ncbi:MAG: DUF3854 domain-containing protein [Planctomycetota bacterium]|nr:DUF3854 domain-containing protein [Planctomycetota bacterium]